MDTLRFYTVSIAFQSTPEWGRDLPRSIGKATGLVSSYVSNLEKLVSRPRLERYRPEDRDDLETAVNYLWNVALSESMLQGIAALEIAMRNAIHNALTQHIGTEYWFQAVLRPNEMKMVDDVWRILSRRHQHPPAPGKIIADLTFGFWPMLFATEYHDLWWNAKASLFKSVFPHIPTGVPPRQAITRKGVHDRLDLCKNLRNRVVHHEPIFQGIIQLNKPIAPLTIVHEQIVEVLAWIDPQLVFTLNVVDRFPDVYRHESARIRNRLMDQFGQP